LRQVFAAATTLPKLCAIPTSTRSQFAAPAVDHFRLAQECLCAARTVFVRKAAFTHCDRGQRAGSLGRGASEDPDGGAFASIHPCVHALHTLLASGELGKLHYVTSNRLNLGKIRREENALWSFAPHDISVILSLTGGQLPDQVRCTGGSYLNERVADTTLTTMRFENGVRSHVFVSWLNPFKEQRLYRCGFRWPRSVRRYKGRGPKS
jgi:UDP-2-acetamido-3-amino-2,3-dideoxy-glucuronate N-acetyltransferase